MVPAAALLFHNAGGAARCDRAAVVYVNHMTIAIR